MILFSIIIPVKEINDYLRKETIPAILKQTAQNFEIIILPDRPTKEKFPKTRIIPTFPKTGPADKRDIGARCARGCILAFLDDDSYPDKRWLKNAEKVFGENKDYVAVGGPSLTPPKNNIYQKASGFVWSTWLGSGGAGTYRASIGARRLVDDFPSVNLMVRKKSFRQIGGFDSHFWPGEDTKLCYDLVYKLGKSIVYDPKVIVYHHRRAVFRDHLKQISRYAIHRGHFARIYPKSSFRFGYFIPTFFTFGLIIGPLIFSVIPFAKYLYFMTLFIYFCLLSVTMIYIYFREKKAVLAMLSGVSIVVTHLVYGALFVIGFFTPRLKR